MFEQLSLVAKLLMIFNATLRVQYYAHEWKVSMITMVPKPGKSILSKFFEKLLISKQTPILNDLECIQNHQFRIRAEASVWKNKIKPFYTSNEITLHYT